MAENGGGGVEYEAEGSLPPGAPTATDEDLFVDDSEEDFVTEGSSGSETGTGKKKKKKKKNKKKNLNTEEVSCTPFSLSLDAKQTHDRSSYHRRR
jgi:hypothetical protein